MEFIIPGSCVPKGRPQVTFKNGRAFAYTPARTRNYAEAARLFALGEYNKNGWELIPYPEPVGISLEFVLRRKPTATPDIANLICQILDNLEGVSYDNDSQVVSISVVKRKGRKPLTRVVVEKIG